MEALSAQPVRVVCLRPFTHIVHGVNSFYFDSFWAMFTAASFKSLFKPGQFDKRVLFAFLNGYPGMDNGCFLLEMLPFRVLFGFPAIVSVDSAKFPLPQLVLFGDQPQMSNIGTYFGNIKQSTHCKDNTPFWGTKH